MAIQRLNGALDLLLYDEPDKYVGSYLVTDVSSHGSNPVKRHTSRSAILKLFLLQMLTAKYFKRYYGNFKWNIIFSGFHWLWSVLNRSQALFKKKKGGVIGCVGGIISFAAGVNGCIGGVIPRAVGAIGCVRSVIWCQVDVTECACSITECAGGVIRRAGDVNGRAGSVTEWASGFTGCLSTAIRCAVGAIGCAVGAIGRVCDVIGCAVDVTECAVGVNGCVDSSIGWCNWMCSRCN